ncbi:transporter [Massilia sp. TS11]|uniref:transporter n=1 Tax=Massilia sp. TS11 TaxID=2908003 RepID=UPI001EDA23E3|nr:transporter [Massilia sp. TS11]MCG2582950.1 transporter [Massilia sp. TS11]
MDQFRFTYGSDLSGLVWGYLFEGGAVRAVDGLTSLDLLAEAGSGRFAWLHFNLSNAASEKWLRAHLALPAEFFETLHQGSRSTRIERAGEHLIGVINDVAHDFHFDPADVSTLWIAVTPHLIVSARRTPLLSIERVRQAVDHGEPIRSPVELLTHLLRDQADVLVGIVRESVERVDLIEDNLLAGRLAHKREDLGAMRRVLVRLQRVLAPEPGALFRLLQRPPAWVAEPDVQELREATEEFSAVLSDMASLKERIKLLQEEISARVDEGSSRTLFVLTMVTVLALPINLVAGLMGMNVGGVPLAQDPQGFWIVVGLLLLVTAIGATILRRLA